MFQSQTYGDFHMDAPICLYHSADNDGAGSAAIVRHKYPDTVLIGVNYNQPIPWNKIPNGATVFMVDFCFEPFDKMIHLAQKCNLTWIDHHISSQDEAKKHNFNPKGIRKIGRSGCELTWQYIFPEKPIPFGIHLLGRYDVWDHVNELVLPFQHGTFNQNTKPDNDEFWHRLFNEDKAFIEQVAADGRVIMQYQNNVNRRYLSSHLFNAHLDDYKAIVVNLGRCSSLVFSDIWDPNEHDLMISFAINKEQKIAVSIYSDKPEIDVSKIAQKFGGGGHAGASGFEFDSIDTFYQHIKPIQ